MGNTYKTLLTYWLLFILNLGTAFFATAQRGKDGAMTVTAANTVVNQLATSITANGNSGNNFIDVDNTLGLAPGDLVLIIQHQGVAINTANDVNFGAITDYRNAGNNELKEVLSVAGGRINFTSPLTNNYSFEVNAAGPFGNVNTYAGTQVIKVPRYTTLTVNGGASITANAWNGRTGGVVAIEVLGNVVINGTIDVSSKGFRGGKSENGSNFNTDPPRVRENNVQWGGNKGEGIAGYDEGANNAYSAYGKYGIGPVANGGGGGGNHNSGGGGGANAGVGAWNGKGIPDRGPGNSYDAAWNLESAGLATNNSVGGGTGGYSFSNNDNNPKVMGPNNGAWGGRDRKNNGGLGGRTLDYSGDRIFFGGGGGSGDANDGCGVPGGIGGGLIYLKSYGAVSGGGRVTANGDTPPGYPVGCAHRNDAGSGGGGGGAIVINAKGAITGVTTEATGGKGSDQRIRGFGPPGQPNETEGPGGGGSGGYIATSSATITRNVSGGNNGITDVNNQIGRDFPPNGATRGAAGVTSAVSNFEIVADGLTECAGEVVTLTANIIGTQPAGTVVQWYSGTTYPGSAKLVHTGATFQPTVGTSDSLYFVQLVPSASYRDTALVKTKSCVFELAVSADTICKGDAASITGTVTGGVPPFKYEWSESTIVNNSNNQTSTITPSPTVTTTYTLNVTDNTNQTISASGTVVVLSPTLAAFPDTCLSVPTFALTGGLPLNGVYTGIGVTAGNFNPTTAGAGNHTITYTQTLGTKSCAATNTIRVKPQPTPQIVPQDPGCSGTDGQLKIHGLAAASYSIVYNGITARNFTLSGVTDTARFANLGGGNYDNIVVTRNGCSATVANQTLTAPPVPNPSIVKKNPTCDGSDGELYILNLKADNYLVRYNAVPNTAYTVANLGDTLKITGLTADTYTNIVVTQGKCKAVLATQTLINPAPLVITTTVKPIANCGENGTIIISGLEANSLYSLTYNDPTAKGPFNRTTNAQGEIEESVPAGTYTDIKITKGICESNLRQETLAVTVVPSVSITPTIVEVCKGDNVSFIATSENGGTMPTYAWKVNGQVPAGSSNTANFSTTTLNNGDRVSVTLASSSACAVPATANSNEVVATVYDVPVADITGETSICKGEKATFTAIGGTTGSVYEWFRNGSKFSNQPIVQVDEASEYRVKITNGGMCSDQTNTILQVISIEVNAGEDRDIRVKEQTAAIPMEGFSNGQNPTWSPAYLFDNPIGVNAIANLGIDTYSFTLSDSIGKCKAEDEVKIRLRGPIWIPNAISPNDDGSNDVWIIKGLEGYDEYTVKVYNRYGDKVFESKDVYTPWDGYNNGTPLPVATYYYVVDVKGDDTYQGSLTIMR